MNGLRVLARQYRLIWNLTVLDFKIRYAGSRLGLIWMAVAPVLMLGGYLLLFGTILQVRPDPGMDEFQYGILIASGLLPWIGFAEGITRGTGSVLAQRNLMKSRVFPMELIPVTAVCTGLVGQVGGTVLVAAVQAFRGSLGPQAMLLPVLILFQAILSVGLVWILSCVNILYRDTSQVVALLLVLLMFLSPIAYTHQMVPAGFEWIVRLNPLSYLIEGYRALLATGRLPDLWGLTGFGTAALLIFHGGYRSFMRLRHMLPDYV